jgi:hypothetical protein
MLKGKLNSNATPTDGFANIELKHGPKKDRHCTDILCGIIFALFLVTSIAVYGYGFKQGNPKQLLIPYDSDAQACGQGKLADFSFIYFANPLSKTNPLSTTVCVK